MGTPTTTVMLFTRGLRLEDNTALNAAVASAAGGGKVLPVFVFTPEQADPDKNAYFSAPAFRYMLESLLELDADLKKKCGCQSGMLFFRGDTVEVLEYLRDHMGATAVYENIDITPYAHERSRRIAEIGGGLEYHGLEDVDLISMNEGKQPSSGKMYEVFTAYWRRLVADYLPCAEPRTDPRVWKAATWAGTRGRGYKDMPRSIKALSRADVSAMAGAEAEGGERAGALPGGQTAAARRLQEFIRERLARYEGDRDFMALANGTSRLSPAVKFGVLSIRELAWAAAKSDRDGWKSAWIRELVWRSFYYHWMWERPELLGRSFHRRFDGAVLAKTGKGKEWRAFVAGRTGIPIVDAAVRELAATGICHNRCRMILATFVSRGLRIWWKVGEAWMARQLMDYDPVSNCFGWQWGHAAAPSAQPYFRVMSPWAQARRFDKDAEYIKRWVPELEGVAARDILRWDEAGVRARVKAAAYPDPILDWKERAAAAIRDYGAAAKNEK